MEKYNHKKIEKKWQEKWEKNEPYKAEDFSKKEKSYLLIEFPYPSGDGLHVGHPRPYIGMDVIARKRRAEGKNVLFPIGWDAFGLPTENYALKTGIHPKEVTKQNTDNFRRQIKMLGISFDWSREINTTDPKYYKWTQWIFLQLFKKGLAYKANVAINWCLSCKIGLANEEVVDEHCERCGGETEKRQKEQWMLAITKYAERLDKDLDDVDYLEPIKIQQRNWIGKSEGAEINFDIKDSDKKIKIFTTRADTLFGATYMVLAPEHELVGELKSQITNFDEVEKYINDTKKKTEIERTAEGKEKTGVELKGVKAINPANKEEIPVFIADYVMAQYGTGAIMAVPAHDQRDFEFAKKYDINIEHVVVEKIGKEQKNSEKRDSVLGIIKNKDGKILIQFNRIAKLYRLPGGGYDDNETDEEALKREIIEETGYTDFDIKKYIGSVAAHYFAVTKNVYRNRIAKAYEIILNSENKQDAKWESDEDLEHQWVSLGEGLEKLLSNSENYGEAALLRLYIEGKSVYVKEGELTNSGKFDGMDTDEAKQEIVKFVGGEMKTTYKLRDWVFSRQRYWGEPIPIIHCEKCGPVAVPEEDLPVELPEIEDYKPTDSGESPLSKATDWVNVKCPSCSGDAKRETDVMPNWAGSSWYYLRYADPNNNKAFADAKNLKYWTPVDWYNGGSEHITLHLLYSRFWHKFLYDLKLVPTHEPYQKRTSHGLILAEGGEKMSKSKGNVVNPDEIVETFGADSLRLYEMFMGPFDQAIAWSTDNIIGMRRFVEKIWRLQEKIEDSYLQIIGDELEISFNNTIKKVGEDIEAMKFNTAISTLMILVNALDTHEEISKKDYSTLLILFAPFAPHVAEELWEKIGNKTSILNEEWPKYDEAKTIEDRVQIGIQINGKVRTSIEISADEAEEKVKKEALSDETVQKWTEGKEIKKVIYIKGKIVSIVTD